MADPIIEFIPQRLAWQCFQHPPAPTPGVHYFSTDDLLVYDPYYDDFGPLNLAQLTRFVRMLNDKLRAAEAEKKRIVYFCRNEHDTRANSALLISAWSMIAQGKNPVDAFKPFNAVRTPFHPFRDASLGTPTFHLTIAHVLAGLQRAMESGFYDVNNFDADEYEHYERVENGDFNWIIRGKFLAFSGPTQTPILYSNDVRTNTPETYYEYFRENNVTGVVRFNNKVYDRQKFLDAGFNHYDLHFADGSNPNDAIIKKFMDIAESEEGSLAVHCKAGLGRTGTLIGLYIMKHYGFNAAETIGFLRLCRPGSVIGPQQNFLHDMEKRMWKEGEAFRKKGPSKVDAEDRQGMSLREQMKSIALGGNKSAVRPAETAASPPASPTKSSSRGISLGFGKQKSIGGFGRR